ncbi:MAG: hypothetical protein ACRDAM_10315 [Casimicrobium sp.]
MLGSITPRVIVAKPPKRLRAGGARKSRKKPTRTKSPGQLGNTMGMILPKPSININLRMSSNPAPEPQTDLEGAFAKWLAQSRTKQQKAFELIKRKDDLKKAIAAGDRKAQLVAKCAISALSK